MDQYYLFDSRDFVLDEQFCRWVLHPTPEQDAFWGQWLQENPHKAAVIHEARQVVRSLQVKNNPISDGEIQDRIKRAARHFQSDETPVSLPFLPWYQAPLMRVAATIIILLGSGWLLYTSFPTHSEPSTYQGLVATAVDPLVEKVNGTDRPMVLRLEDGSLVTLQKDSRISYSLGFSGANREVYLTGEAFFEVTKDPNRPFLVYANEIVTKVLGTSFNVKAYASAKEVAVEVKTGKVSVYAGSDPMTKEKASNRELEGVVLTPNQRIVYSREEVRMTKSLVERPAVVESSSPSLDFIFEDTPISEVFEALEKYYKVDIVYDEELMQHCPLTASLANQPFFEKMSIICKAIESRYEVIDGQVVVYAKGCQN